MQLLSRSKQKLFIVRQKSSLTSSRYKKLCWGKYCRAFNYSTFDNKYSAQQSLCQKGYISKRKISTSKWDLSFGDRMDSCRNAIIEYRFNAGRKKGNENS